MHHCDVSTCCKAIKCGKLSTEKRKNEQSKIETSFAPFKVQIDATKTLKAIANLVCSHSGPVYKLERVG